MSLPNLSRHRIATAIATTCAGLALASATGAVDLRDWGRKHDTTSERLVVPAQFENPTASGTSIPQKHGPDQVRLEEIRCLRRNQPGSNCRASL